MNPASPGALGEVRRRLGLALPDAHLLDRQGLAHLEVGDRDVLHLAGARNRGEAGVDQLPPDRGEALARDVKAHLATAAIAQAQLRAGCSR